MSLHFDVVILGGGIVGLACAESMSVRYPGRDILVLEKNGGWGQGITSRSSEVIHAGLYYKEGSLKESHCLRGSKLLYQFLEQHRLPFRKTEKLIVAQNEEEEKYLLGILETSKRLELSCSILNQREVSKKEPLVFGSRALLSHDSGIFSSEHVVQKLAELAQERGVVLQTSSQVIGWRFEKPSFTVLEIQDPFQSYEIYARSVINCLGLNALTVYENGNAEHAGSHLQMAYVRGHYFSMNSRWQGKVQRLVYPIPDFAGGGLGIHLTLDLEGACRLGPDTDWSHSNEPSYFFQEDRLGELSEKFYKCAKRYLPELRIEDLSPGYIGVRPKLIYRKNSSRVDDFVIQYDAQNRWLNFFGIESPGLTAALSLAKTASNDRFLSENGLLF